MDDFRTNGKKKNLRGQTLGNYWCNIGPKCCVWKKGVHRKRNTQIWNLRKKNSSRFYSLGLQRVVARKVRFIMFFLPPLLGGNSGVVVAGLLTHSCQLYVAGWVCTDQGVWDLWRTCLETCFELPQISLLDFLYRDFKDQFEDSRMFGDTSENHNETHESSCVIILKSRLNSAGHSARTR